MIRKALYAAALLALASGAYAATDYPSGYTKCAKEGETCSFSGTRSVAYGKAGTFVYANLTGPFTCAGIAVPVDQRGHSALLLVRRGRDTAGLPRHDHRPGHQRCVSLPAQRLLPALR